MLSLKSRLLTILVAATINLSLAQRFYGPEDPRLQIELTLEHPCNGVSTTPDGRLFVVYARVDGSKGPQVAEYDRTTNTSTAYPKEEWNSYTDCGDPATHLVGVNGQRIGPDGQLWIIDKGAAELVERCFFPMARSWWLLILPRMKSAG